jgi:hypothetical protein
MLSELSQLFPWELPREGLVWGQNRGKTDATFFRGKPKSRTGGRNSELYDNRLWRSVGVHSILI